MRFFIDGRLDTRPLSSQDVAHIGLPYAEIEIEVTPITIANGATDSFAIDTDDWGAGDLYLTRLILVLLNATEPNNTTTEGILTELSLTRGTDLIIFLANDIQDRFVARTSDYQLRKTYPITGKVLETETLNFYIQNFSGVSITAALWIAGMVK